jgi:hypothetical protein
MTPTITVKEDKRYNTITVKEDKRYNGSIRRYFDLFHDHLDKCDGTDWDDVESDMYFGIEEYLRNCKSKIFEDIQTESHMDVQRNTRANLVVTYHFQGVYAYCLEDSKTKVKEWFVEHEGALGSGMLLPDIREVA